MSSARTIPTAASNDTKRQQNNMLLLNAMRTTAVHARESFQLPAALSEETVPETPATATAGRSSVTPAPAPGGIATRAPSIAPTPQESTRGLPGGGKKKKKSRSTGPYYVMWSEAKFILLRNGDPSTTNWVNVRVFLVLADPRLGH